MFILKNKNGFTIIELLIVIVVIGILALLALNTFQMVQRRARNAQVIATAAAYKKAITAYIIDNQEYPQSHGDYRCVGVGYDDLGGTLVEIVA